MVLLMPLRAHAQEAEPKAGFDGLWVINEDESDDTDRQVEKAIKDAGGRLPRTGKRGKGRYRGGPSDQELYDHISYDDVLQIRIEEPEVSFNYPEGFRRVFYTDSRSRSFSASDDDRKDYSFAAWQGDSLLVESRPRDGGRIYETYTLEAGGQRLRLDVQLKPSTFRSAVEIVRVFNRYQEEEKN